MRAVQFDSFGEAEQVLQVREIGEPEEPGPGQVRVRMLASPINPSDLMYIRGQYGARPKSLPATPGFEGVGVVETAGRGLLPRLRLGRRVAVLNAATGTWREQVIARARYVIPIPADLPDEQAAAFFVNPASALVMTAYVLKVPRGAWLLQTAAGSALGRMVLRLGKQAGFRTINVVRRREQAEELLKEGGDAVICTADESIPERVHALTQGQGVPFALDAVGGTTGLEVVKALGPDGRMIVYGTLADEPIPLPSRLLMVGQRSIEGFWLSQWAAKQSIPTMLGLIRRLRRLFRTGVVTSEFGMTFPLDQIKQAVHQAAQPGRKGKTLLRIGDR
jgi:NADPH:quinone reductase-like Zn-dependent oxidoreductase